MSELMRNQVELLVQQLWDLNDQASGDALLDHDAAQRLTIERLERDLANEVAQNNIAGAQLVAVTRELDAIRATVGDTEFSLRQQLAAEVAQNNIAGQQLVAAKKEIERLTALRERHEAGYQETIAQLQAVIAEREARIIQLEAEIDAVAWKVSPAMAQAKIDELNATVERLMAERSLYHLGTCLWTETKDGHWETGCNQMHCFEDGSPSDNHLQYCGYCGERLTEQRWT